MSAIDAGQEGVLLWPKAGHHESALRTPAVPAAHGGCKCSWQGPVLQQLEHPISCDVSVNDCFRPVARFFDRITRPEQLLACLPKAMRVLTSPADTGAVVLALPQDVQSEAWDYPESFFEDREWLLPRREPEPTQVRAVAQLLARANRPFVIAGGGVIYSNAEEALATFAGEMGAPVAETFGGKGAVQGKAWWAVGGLGVEGNPAANALAAKADVVLSVGSRLTDFATGSQSLFQGTDVRFASINVSDHDASKQGALPIVADARLALMALAKACGEAGARTNPEWEAEVRSVVGDWEGTRATAVSADDGELLSQGQLIGLLQESSCSGDILIAASGSPPGDLLKVWDATDGRECHLEFGYSCMGYEVPATLGVRMARPHGEVVALVGDGAF